MLARRSPQSGAYGRRSPQDGKGDKAMAYNRKFGAKWAVAAAAVLLALTATSGSSYGDVTDLTVNPTGLLYQNGLAVISGTVTCSATDVAGVQLNVCAGPTGRGRDRFFVSCGQLMTGMMACTGSSEAWTVVVVPPPHMGFVFLPGPIDVTVNAQTATGSKQWVGQVTLTRTP